MARKIALFLFLMVATAVPGAAFADFDCDADYLSGFDDRLLDGTCEEVHSAPIATPSGTSTLRVLRYAGPTHGADTWTGQIDEVAGRVSAAMGEMGGLRLQGTVTLFLVPDTLIDTIPGTGLTGPIHGTLSGLGPDECLLSMYKLPEEISTAEFAFTLAHEIFHCIQAETWYDQYRVPESDWWLEGSAEYFAALAFPGSEDAISRARQFDTGILDNSIVLLAYDTIVFFSWIGQTSGPSAVPPLLAAMATTVGTGAQIDALRGQISEDTWKQFAEDYLSGRVQLPGGDTVPIPLNVRGYAQYPDDMDRETDFSPEPFQIDRIDLVFKRDHTFDIITAENRLTTGASEDGGPYGPMLTSVDTCEGDRRLRFYSTKTMSGGPGQLIVTSPDLGPGACCLIGEWVPTEEALNGVATFGTDMAGLVCGYHGGGWQLSFRADGTGQITYSDFANTCKSPTAPMQVDNILNGSTEFDWTTSSAEAAKLTFTSHSMSQSLQLTVGEMVQDLSGNYPGPSTGATGMAYTCAGNALSVVGMFNLFVQQADHTKLIPIPE